MPVRLSRAVAREAVPVGSRCGVAVPRVYAQVVFKLLQSLPVTRVCVCVLLALFLRLYFADVVEVAPATGTAAGKGMTGAGAGAGGGAGGGTWSPSK